jgi:hypothetical protein
MRHLALGTVLFLAIMAAPLMLMGIRSWRRIAYPDRLPGRWPENSPILRRMEILQWLVYGAGASATIAGLFLFDSSHRLARATCWIVFGSYGGFRLLLTYYIHDRKPLPPEIALGWMDSAKPLQSANWGQPA